MLLLWSKEVLSPGGSGQHDWRGLLQWGEIGGKEEKKKRREREKGMVVRSVKNSEGKEESKREEPKTQERLIP